MKVQVLVATTNQEDFSLLDKMHITTSALVGNQCEKNEIVTFQHKGQDVKWLSFAERGVGLNRNNTLMRADGDIVIFADDDMVYVENYEKIVKEAYERIPQADVIIFDLQYPNGENRPIRKIERLSVRKCMGYGAARITARRSALHLNGLAFHLCFGGGAAFSSGEDTVFLVDCLRKGLKIYAYPVVIASLTGRESTWFQGYNDKYFYDKGVVFSVMFPKLCKAYALYHCFKHRKRYNTYGWRNALKQMHRGCNDRRHFTCFQ